MKRTLFLLLFAVLSLAPRHAVALNRLIEVLAVGVTDDEGEPLPAGTVTVYDAGTSNLRTVYSDFALGSPVVNPYTLDSAGRAVLYTDRRIKLLIKDSEGATVRTIDNVGTADSDLASSSATALAGDGLTAPGDGTVAVNPDTTSLEVSSDLLRVKPGGIAQGPDGILNYSCSASVGSSALTVSLKDKSGADPSSSSYATVPFRSSTVTSGVYNTRTATGALTPLVISSGSTLGHVSAAEWPIYVYVLDNSGTMELALSTSPVDERYVQTTTAEGGAGAADSPAVLYSTTARSNVPVRLLCVMKSTQATAGTWAAVPTHISAATKAHPIASAVARPASATAGIGGFALSSSCGTFTTTSTSADPVTNLSVTLTTSGRPVWVGIVPDSGNNGALYSTQPSGSSVCTVQLRLRRDGSNIAGQDGYATQINTTPNTQFTSWTPSLFTYDFVAAGTYTYTVTLNRDAGCTNAKLDDVKLGAFEQ